MRPYLKIALPVIILVVGLVVARQLLVHSPKAQREAIVTLPPQVQVIQVKPQDVRIPVMTQGTVRPATSINLSAEVTGRIVRVAPQFANGGFFSKGDVLLQVNPSDYTLAITKAEALVASANQQLARTEAEYKQKLEEYKGVDLSTVSDVALRKPEYEEAKARLKAAEADLDLAKVQLARCEIKAPFDGRVVEKKADLGQYVTPGTVVASAYAVDVAEVRLPLSQSQINLLDLSAYVGQQRVRQQKAEQQKNGQQKPAQSIAVRLTGVVGGRQHTWEGRIVRTEAVIDERNRLQYVVAQVADPYHLHTDATVAPPLTSGLFVEAQIEGRLLQDVFVLPRLAIHGNNQVWLLDGESRLRMREVSLVHRGEDKAYVAQGLNSGDTVIVSPLDAVVEGMQLRLESSQADAVANGD